MSELERLVAAGIPPKKALDICVWYLSRKDEDGLESYVCSVESNKSGN